MVVVSAASARYSSQFEVSSGIFDKFVSGAREVMDSVLLAVGLDAVSVTVEVVHYSEIFELSSGVFEKIVPGKDVHGCRTACDVCRWSGSGSSRSIFCLDLEEVSDVNGFSLSNKQKNMFGIRNTDLRILNRKLEFLP